MSIRRFVGNVFMASTMALPIPQTTNKQPVIAQTYGVLACKYEGIIYYDLTRNGYGLDMIVEFDTSSTPKRAFVADDIPKDDYFVNLHLKPRPRNVTFVPRDSKTFSTFSEKYASINPKRD